MATIKSYTDLVQSKKLEGILPLESADMLFNVGAHKYADSIRVHLTKEHWEQMMPDINPCWSLAALLGVLPEYNLQRTDWGDKTEYKIVVTTDEENYASKNYDNAVDACYEMILKLHELNLL